MNTIRILHPFKMGDLLCLLPGLQHIYETNGTKSLIYQRLGMPVYFEGSNEQCMGHAMFLMIKPLIEVQEYIESFEIWEGQKVDLDTTPSRDSRVIPLPNGSIHHWVWSIAPELQCDLFRAWIHVDAHEDTFFADKIIVNRTSRYTNPYITYYFLKPYQDKILFVGTQEEHETFQTENKLELTRLQPKNFYELARIIKSVKLTLTNQNGIWHIADGCKSLRLLECSVTFPNTYPTGMNGYFFLHQKSLELQFQKLVGSK